MPGPNTIEFRLAIRGYAGEQKVFEQLVTLPVERLDQLLPDLAREHAKMVSHEVHMIEIEFLDEPDVNQRFFRIGTDPRGMVLPIRIQ
jgi:hypothetical protein